MASTREYDFLTPIETPSIPSGGTPTGDDDLIPKGFADEWYGMNDCDGTHFNLPESVVAGTSIPVEDKQWQVCWVKGTGGVTVTANPRIGVTTKQNSVLILIGTSDVDYVRLENGNGLVLNGWVELGYGKSITLVHDVISGFWVEVSRNA